MRLKNLDLVIALLIAAINVGWAFFPTHLVVVGIICALPLVFIIPGYVLTEALFKRGGLLLRKPGATNTAMSRPFTTSDRLILSLGLSLAIVIINGFVLNMLPVGLGEASWAVSLTVLTAVFSLIALFRRRETQTGPVALDKTSRRFRVTFYEVFLFLLAIVIVISSVWYSVASAEHQQQQSTFTQFWVVPSKQANNGCAVLVGIQNFQPATVTYNVVVTANGKQVATWPAIVLALQDQWYRSLSIQPTDASNVYVEAKLYRADKPDILYREAHLTMINSTGGGKQILKC